MNYKNILIDRRTLSWRQTLQFLALAAVSADVLSAQHLNLTVSRSMSTQAALLEAATSPAHFASFVGEPSMLAAARPHASAVDFSISSAGVGPGNGSLSAALPDSPSAFSGTSDTSVDPSTEIESQPGQFSTLDAKTAPRSPDNRPIAPQYTKYVPPGWAYQPIHGRQKFILGARDLYTPANILGFFVSAGYSHLVNGQPNYGTDKGAFGERLGAAAIRNTAQGIFTDGVFAVMFHQDPRYFGEGRSYSVVHRALYAATRPIIVRTTNGTGSTVNSSLLAGYAAAAVLNNAYYPSINRNVKDTFSSYGGSIGGAALGFLVQEFSDDALQFLHLKRKP